MNERNDSYIMLAFGIAAVAIATNFYTTYEFTNGSDLNVRFLLSIASFIMPQLATALAMVCAVIIGRNMLSGPKPDGALPATAPEPQPRPQDTF